MAESPFVPGARVALRSGYSDNYSERFVEKVYKTGNFTLRGDKQQWRPNSWMSYGDNAKLQWSAHPTGQGWSHRRSSVKPWNEETDREIQEAIAKARRVERLHAVQQKIHRLRGSDVTDEMLDQIEAALPKSEAKAA